METLNNSSSVIEGDDDPILPPSELGTKDYWESAYCEELSNFSDHGDPGDVWFGKGITRKMVDWVDSHVDASRDKISILDIGCGNGMTLVYFHRKGFTNLTGVDYSKAAVNLAKSVASSNACPDIVFDTMDILDPSVETYGPFNVIVDKGTFDAICLNPDMDIKESINRYLAFLGRHLLMEGYFLITSCNWTKEELLRHFSPFSLKLIDEIETPSLSFGGKKGNKVTSLIFQKH